MQGASRTRRGRLVPAALALALLTGCAALPRVPADQVRGDGAVVDFALSGRLSIRQAGTGAAATRNDVVALDWAHAPPQDHVVLRSPLGPQLMQLDETPGAVRLTLPDRAPLQASDEDALLQQALGYTLPVHALAHWMLHDALARAPDTPAEQVLAVDLEGWSGSLTRWRTLNGVAVPGLIVLERGPLRLRLVVDHWSLQRAPH